MKEVLTFICLYSINIPCCWCFLGYCLSYFLPVPVRFFLGFSEPAYSVPTVNGATPNCLSQERPRLPWVNCFKDAGFDVVVFVQLLSCFYYQISKLFTTRNSNYSMYSMLRKSSRIQRMVEFSKIPRKMLESR